jgi:hypothetical protein
VTPSSLPLGAYTFEEFLEHYGEVEGQHQVRTALRDHNSSALQ